MLYRLYDMNRAALGPLQLAAEATRNIFANPFLPFAHTRAGRAVVAGVDVLGGVIKTYGKPDWRIDGVEVEGRWRPVVVEEMLATPFCRLVRFSRADGGRGRPKIVLVAPLSGHYATLLGGTVRGLVAQHDVYVTDWVDAREIPVDAGPFGIAHYIDLIMACLREIGENANMVAVCQPAPLVLAVAAILGETEDAPTPATMTLMGGPVDPRRARTQVTDVALSHTLDFFEHTVISQVPPYYPGAYRRVYPGFIQLSAFISMNPTRHVESHLNHFHHLVQGDGESAEAHKKFYNEYLSVMDIPAEFYLETLDVVFKRMLIPDGRYVWRDQRVAPEAITKTALLTVEGALDDISAPGQTLAAHAVCAGLSDDKRAHLLQDGVGHYGIFNGRRWREHIAPTIAAFIQDHDPSQRRGLRAFARPRTRHLDPAPALLQAAEWRSGAENRDISVT